MIIRKINFDNLNWKWLLLTAELKFKLHKITLLSSLLLGLTVIEIKGQTVEVILGRPTQKSITASIRVGIDYFIQVEYGIDRVNFVNKSIEILQTSEFPVEIEIDGLNSNSRYYYRVSYRKNGNSPILKSEVYSFHTQRSKGSPFIFTLESDEHLYDKKGVRSLYDICLKNQLLDSPDFMLSLGDIFGDDHYPFTITEQEIKSLHESYRPILSKIAHSIPFYVCLGNHEGEMDYYLNSKPGDNLAHYSTHYRKLYYPNPFPNDFYSGNSQKEPFGIEYPENYYSWIWGDVQFIVLDVYRDQCDTSPKPGSWNWTLGQDQYNWFKNTLETSQCKFKLVFAHHVSGQGRGGIIQAKYYEWGGYDKKSNNYVFLSKRPNMTKSIHELMNENGVNIFFQGHDHIFAREVLDGVVYQTLPMPSDSTYKIGKLANADAFTGDTIEGSGHLKVTVNEDCINVDFIQAYLPKDTMINNMKNRQIAFTYSVGDCNKTGSVKEQNDLFEIYPNPTSNFLYIKNAIQNSNFSIEFFDLFGKEICVETQSDKLNLTNLPTGIYNLKIKLNNSYQNFMVLKQ